MNRIFYSILLLILLLPASLVHGYNMRQTYNVEGLPNSAIMSMSADKDGLLWMGTCDGVSIADGLDVTQFQDMYPGLVLSGSVIENILHTADGKTWIQTNHGLDLFDRKEGSLVTFPEYGGIQLITLNDKGDLLLFSTGGVLYNYQYGKSGGFREIAPIDVKHEDVLAITAQDDNLILVTKRGVVSCKLFFDPKSQQYRLVDVTKGFVDRIDYAAVDKGSVKAVTGRGMLGRIKADGTFEPIVDIKNKIREFGDISDIISDHEGNIFVSFYTNGIMRISSDETGPTISDFDTHVGVFCLEASDTQNAVWIGTDCQGLFTLSSSEYNIRSYDFNDLKNLISHPIRSLYLDNDSTLWIGTKGSGILCIDNFSENTPGKITGKLSQFKKENSPLHHNSVFVFEPSRGPRMWIGTDQGLNYYDFTSRQLKSIPYHEYLKYIHDIYEVDENTLLLATLRGGLVKATIGGTPSNPEITELKKYVVDNGDISSNFFFSISDIPGQGIILSNRGKGVFKFENERLRAIELRDDYPNQSTYDIFASVGDPNTLWLGTGNGLLRKDSDGETLFNGIENGFANNTIHEMIRDKDGELWIATNRGLVRFNTDNNESTAYTRETGLGISEFSDGAGYATDESILFGGVDGFVIVSPNKAAIDSTSINYMPPIRLQRLNISGKNTAIAKYVSFDDSDPELTLNHNQNQFSVTFTAPDFIYASNYSYYYAIDHTDEWINNGNNRTITFNELGYGKYRLYVKYVNRMTGIESEPFLLRIKINAPWYLSTLAIVVYILLIIACVVAFMYALMRRQKLRQMNELKLMRYTHREELYEEKLRFFTNITHEFSTPLTLIYGPCERLLNYAGADEYTKRYVGIIRTSAERLNNLIQELIEFRRIETGHKKLKIHPVDISTLCRDTLSAYEELAETNSIDLKSHIGDNIEWNSDFSALRKVLNNLISNAFKYTPVGGRIELDVHTENDNMVLSVYNSGKGISEEDKATIFNRYAVLDNVEENAIKGLASRNGLGLAICYSIVEMLKGTIEIDSTVGEYARFIVTLPRLNATVSTETHAEKPKEEAPATSPAPVPEAAPAKIQDEPATSPKVSTVSKEKKTILVVDDNTEILSLLSDSLKEYNVLTATSAMEGTEILTRQMPDLIITDVMMPGIDGFEFTRNIKNNIHTSHLPMIILSAKNSVKEQVDGLKSGADVYIGKPFSLSYLNAVIKRLLDQRSSLKEYYTSSGSAFEYSNGKLMSREDSDLVAKATAYVEEHIEDADLTPDTLAQYLQMSVRHLYRKFKDLEMPSPNDFIKDMRMAVVVKLLVTTQLNMQEIMYKTGFNNRSHFYREFSKRYDMTPTQYRSTHQQADNSLNSSHKNGGGKFQLTTNSNSHSIVVED